MRTAQKRAQGKQCKNRRGVCSKVRFRDRELVTDALRRASLSRGQAFEYGVTSRRREVRYYECPYCRGFHLTSQQLREVM
jgi:hypothetical protein